GSRAYSLCRRARSFVRPVFMTSFVRGSRMVYTPPCVCAPPKSALTRPPRFHLWKNPLIRPQESPESQLAPRLDECPVEFLLESCSRVDGGPSASKPRRSRPLSGLPFT